MKKIWFFNAYTLPKTVRAAFLTVYLLLLTIVVWAATEPSDTLKYTDASEFELIGKGFQDTQTRYERLPASLESLTRPPVWSLSKNSSGLAVRFRTNSEIIAVRWEVTKNTVMNHFAPTGIKGVDLYCLEGGNWLFVNSGRPSTEKLTNAVIISHMVGVEKEYMLYLPLYDGVSRLEIGVSHGAFIGNPLVDSPRKTKPVVFYGTSITQGGCASRTGMAYPSILARMLDRQTINLGFSGNGRLDLEVAEAMADLDASCFVIDCLPNCTPELMRENYIRFFQILRDKNPQVPILLVENLHYSHMAFSTSVNETVNAKNTLLQEIYRELKKKGDRRVYYLKADNLIGNDLEPSVDGVHLTDLGFLRLAQNMYPVIRKLIR